MTAITAKTERPAAGDTSGSFVATSKKLRFTALLADSASNQEARVKLMVYGEDTNWYDYKLAGNPVALSVDGAGSRDMIEIDVTAGSQRFGLLCEGGVPSGLSTYLTSLTDPSATALTDSTLSGTTTFAGPIVPAVSAEAEVTGSVPLIFRQTVASGANGSEDIVVSPKIRVLDAWAVMKGAGTTGSTLRITNGTATNYITEALDVSAKGDKASTHFATFDDAYHEIAAAGTLRVTKASTGGDFPGAEVYVLAIRVA